MEKLFYEAPTIEVVEVQIEQGFATSGGNGDFSVPNGNNWGGGWL